MSSLTDMAALVMHKVAVRAIELVARDSLGPDATPAEVGGLMTKLFERGSKSVAESGLSESPAEDAMYAQMTHANRERGQ